jgi:hypothetical protein
MSQRASHASQPASRTSHLASQMHDVWHSLGAITVQRMSHMAQPGGHTVQRMSQMAQPGGHLAQHVGQRHDTWPSLGAILCSV